MNRRCVLIGIGMLTACAGLVACGQKGPLYLPEERDEDEKDKRKKDGTASRDERNKRA